jgi:uncharacterized protein
MSRFSVSVVSAFSIAAALFAAGAVYAQAVDALSFDRKLRLAKAGDEDAQIAIARAYESGDEVDVNRAEAANWYRQAADHGNAVAMFGLARLISQGGPGVERSPELAAKLYESAARQGHVEAQNWLGYCYQHGLGVQQSDASAIEWYTKAADGGFPAAQNNLGLMYLTGKGIERDYGKASSLFEQAAKSGDAWGANNLAGLYEMGWGVKQDWQKALAYYHQASEQGNKHAAQGFRRLSTALGPTVTKAIVASISETGKSDKEGEKPGVSSSTLKSQAAPNVEQASPPKPKKPKTTKPRTVTKKQTAPTDGLITTRKTKSQGTSKPRGTCRDSLLQGLFETLRLCD